MSFVLCFVINQTKLITQEAWYHTIFLFVYITCNPKNGTINVNTYADITVQTMYNVSVGGVCIVGFGLLLLLLLLLLLFCFLF